MPEVFGRLTVLKELSPSNGRRILCRCSCGEVKEFPYANLISGNTKSCGCYRRQRTAEKNTTHGLHSVPEYSIWKQMRQRCSNPNNDRFQDYGGRGVTVCERWHSFENFLLDMGSRPSVEHSIERRENESGYCPENCYWGTRIEQGNNKRNNHLVTFDGKTLTLAEWSRKVGLRGLTIMRRLEAGWSTEKALTTPSRSPKSRKRT